ncbi:MAG: hypothetical protein LBQ18_00675 [Campylobacteraceae bacterium]|jgi:hypothetical protein|nr:hypothetical protein [Campylobacteraceae bacterium]
MFKFPTNIFDGDLSDKGLAVLVSGVSKDTIISSTLCKLKSSFSLFVGSSLLSVSLLFVGCGDGDGDEDRNGGGSNGGGIEQGYYNIFFYDRDLNCIAGAKVAEGSSANMTDIRKRFNLGATWYAAGSSINVANDENYNINSHISLYATTGINEINTEAKLGAISNNPTGKYVLTGDITLTSDWEPIGIFKGVFSGNHHIINGLRIDKTTNNVGLFGILDGAEVKKLGVVIDGSGVIGGSYTGGIAGRLTNTAHISDSYVIGDVSGENGVGGIAGRIEGGSKITGSYSAGSVKGYERVGGIAGQIVGEDKGDFAEINNSYSTVDVEAQNYAGGIVGGLDKEGTYIVNTYAAGSVKAVSNVGGIVGYLYGNAHNNVAINPSVRRDAGAPVSNRIAGYVDAAHQATNNLAFEGMSGSFSDSSVEANHGISKSAAQLKQRATYENISWDFNETWKIDEGASYPKLIWER